MKRQCLKTANADSSRRGRTATVFTMPVVGRCWRVVIQDASNVPVTKEAVV